jgi:hypothetical protein
MKKKSNDSKPNVQDKANDEKTNFPGYPAYPASEDIYNKFQKESDINPEDISKNKEIIKIDNLDPLNEKDFEADVSGGDLDIPGSELDDDQENIGSEDEENNHYSIGGDNHTNLDENKGE